VRFAARVFSIIFNRLDIDYRWLGGSFVTQVNVAASDQSSSQAASGVAGRYASALFGLASDQKAVPATAAALNSFQALMDESDDLQRLMKSPVFKVGSQMEAVTALATKAKISGLALNFLKLMCQNRRLAAVPSTIASFNTLVAQSKGETTAEITSAEALSAKQLADLKTALKSVTGSDVALVTKTDPAILGGLIVKVGSRMMDNSLRTKLNSLKVAMKGTA
jgi:F-type H+-transporting ATPase subunit delta